MCTWYLSTVLKRPPKVFNTAFTNFFRLRDGLKVVLNISKLGNQYIQANKPWVLVKGSEDERSRAGSVVGLACNLTSLLSILIHPFMPDVSAEIRKQLQVSDEYCVVIDAFVPHLETGHIIGEPKPLFEKMDGNKMEEFRQLYSGQQSDRNKGKPTEEEIKALEGDISKQGDVVRQLKANKAEKSIIDAEVAKLLDLKKKLSLATGANPNDTSAKKKIKKTKK